MNTRETAKAAWVNRQEKLTTAQDIHPISADLQHNRVVLEQMFGSSTDIKIRQMYLGKEKQVCCMAAYIEITAGSLAFEDLI